MAITSEALSPVVSAGPDPMRPVPFRVHRLHAETRDCFTIVLTPIGEPRTFSFLPGQFNMLYAFGVGEVPISMSGPPGGVREIVHTIRAVGPVTQTLQRLRKGDPVGVRGPFGTAWPVEEARGQDVVLVAGGIGLAPLRPALHHLLAHRERYGRIALLYGARTPADLLFSRELEAWRGRFDVDVEIIVDRAAPDWHGLVGVVTTLIPRVHFDPGNTVAFIVGPEIMMGFAARELEQRGLTAEQIHVSLERNMKCGVGFCGHCQLGPAFVCKDGPVFRYDRVAGLLGIREV
jgi:NAD(P)H-flavin reductase